METRQKIYDFIEKNPGLHLRELSRKIDISFGSLRYHLDYLKKQGLVVSKVNCKYTRYYATQKVCKKDIEMFNLLRQEIPQKLILLLLSIGPGSIYKNKEYCKKLEDIGSSTYPPAYSKKELIELTRYWKGPYAKLFHLNKHPTTVDFHLQKLLDADLIEKIRIGRELKYRIKDTDKIFTFLIIYNYELTDAVNIWLRWTKIFSQKNIESVEEFVFDILPHPYHV